MNKILPNLLSTGGSIGNKALCLIQHLQKNGGVE